jgi:hypothetical protein
MSVSFLAGLSVGLFAGGFIGALAVASVALSSERRFRRASSEVSLADAGNRAAQTWAESSGRIDLQSDLRGLKRSAEQPVVEADDIEQEMRELVRRYGTQSGS